MRDHSLADWIPTHSVLNIKSMKYSTKRLIHSACLRSRSAPEAEDAMIDERDNLFRKER